MCIENVSCVKLAVVTLTVPSFLVSRPIRRIRLQNTGRLRHRSETLLCLTSSHSPVISSNRWRSTISEIRLYNARKTTCTVRRSCRNDPKTCGCVPYVLQNGTWGLFIILGSKQDKCDQFVVVVYTAALNLVSDFFPSFSGCTLRQHLWIIIIK